MCSAVSSSLTHATRGVDQFISGYSLRGQEVSAALCTPSDRARATNGRTVRFDREDNPPAGEPGRAFALSHFKGRCRTDEYVAGVASTGAWAKGKTPDALPFRTP